ncbi:MAG TPA: hypothetical protein VKN76_05830 [Kiloniellaceae bacterium]|nr:hypothetical protein [Kiloniellaceae bacterium]
MSLGLRESRARRRRQIWWSVTKWLLALALILAAGVYAYYAGSNLAQREVERQQAEIDALEAQVEALNQEKQKILLQTKAIARRAKEWEEQYRVDIPNDSVRRLLTAVRAKLDGGLDANRLGFLIDAAEEPHDCEEDPDSKRFIVKIDNRSNGNDSVSFDRAVVVTASGAAAEDEDGNRQGWYDPDKPLKVTFRHLSGETSEIEATLPIHHSMIVEDQEFRFALVPGDRGFVTVTGQRCSYP